MSKTFRILMIMCLLCKHHCTLAQKQGQFLVDSLITELSKVKEDTSKIKLLNMIAFSYQGIDNEKIMVYASQALNLAEKLKWKKEIALALNNIAGHYLIKYQNDSAIINAKRAFGIATEEKNGAIACQSNIHLGFAYLDLRENGKALDYFQQAEKLSKQLDEKLLLGNAFFGIGNVHWNLSDYSKALDYFQKVNKIADAQNDAYLLERSETYIAFSLYYYEPTKAIEHYKKAMLICEQYGYTFHLATLLINLSLSYADMEKYNESIACNIKALAIFEKMAYKPGIGTANSYLGYAYLCSKDYINALSHIQIALEPAMFVSITQTSDDLIQMLRIYNEAPENDLKKIGISVNEALAKALEYGNRALEMAKKNTSLPTLSDAYKYMSEVYEKQKNTAMALDAYKQHIIIRDSIFNLDNQKEITRKDMQFGFDKKQLTDSLHNDEVKKNEAFKLQRQKTFTYAGLGGIALLLILSIVIFRFYNKQKKTNILLSNTLTQLTETQKQLIKSEKMAAFGSMASRLAHEIQNPLNFVNNFSELSGELVNELVTIENKEERDEVANMLISNLEKINHHGKRAEVFIKELLKHSREGTAHQYFEE